MNMMRCLCSHCGTRIESPVTDAGRTVLCGTCCKPVKLPPLSDIELASTETSSRRSHDDFELHAAPPASPSLTTPAAQPVESKDADKALTNVALGIFRVKKWPCQEEAGYRAFTTKISFHNVNGASSPDTYRVFAERGLLIIESLVLELPALPGVPILETLNQVNQRSVAAVFALTPAGVVMRHAVVPRTRAEGYFTGAMILQTLRQMNYDRRHALSLLRTVVESSALDPLEVARVFSQPMAPSALQSHSLEQAADLAEFAGFQVQQLSGQIGVTRNGATVYIGVCPGFMRGWVKLGEPSPVLGAWTFIPPKLRGLCANIHVLGNDENRLLEQLNALNAKASLLRFVYVKRQAVATATAFPTDEIMTVDQFKVFAGALLDCAQHSVPAAPKELVKLAG